MGQRLVGNYTHIFQDLKRKIFELTANQWQPRLFISDFETAIRTALHAEFPGVTVHGCYYHFCAAVWKKARELNITGPGSRALLGQHWPAIQTFIRKLMSMAFLPLAVVRNNFTVICTDQENTRLAMQHRELRECIRYFGQNWVNPGRVAAPATWNVYVLNMDMRSNNHVECKSTHI